MQLNSLPRGAILTRTRGMHGRFRREGSNRS
jgi:hypothetical protein